MAVTLFHRDVIIIKNKVTIKNGTKEDPKEQAAKEQINAKIRGKTYGRRTVTRQN